MKEQCKKCICTSCINQTGCKRSCEQCEILQGYVSYCVAECRCEQIEMSGNDNERIGKEKNIKMKRKGNDMIYLIGFIVYGLGDCHRSAADIACIVEWW